MSTSSKSSSPEFASMSAARSKVSNAPPTASRDGFHLIPTTPTVYDLDLTEHYQFKDITYKVSCEDMVARIAFNRPEVLHSFRPTTINEIRQAMEVAQDDVRVAVIILTSEIYPNKTNAFCAGGDQNVRGEGGYDDGTEAAPRLRVLDLQVQMRRNPKPIMCVVYGYAIGGGHILHMIADLTIAADDAVFGQTGPRMGSFDAGYGSTHMARLVGQKKAREMWFLARFYDAHEALKMGLINAIYPKELLEGEAARWCRRMVMNSPTAIACCKAALNADEDGQAGIALLAGQATRLFYLSEESKEGKKAFLEKRPPEFRSVMSSRL